MDRIDRVQLPTQPGQKLPNQAVILCNRWYEISETKMVGIVLAVTGYPPEPFATWERCVEIGRTSFGMRQQIDQTYWGHYHRGLGHALEDFNKRVDRALSLIADTLTMAQRGRDDGVAAASWIVDGNTVAPYTLLSNILQGMENGDPAVMDTLPVPHIGGEFADDPTWEQICMEEVEHYNDEGEPELEAVYHENFHQGVEQQLRAMHESYKHSGKVAD
jgi:hypothetical protein